MSAPQETFAFRGDQVSVFLNDGQHGAFLTAKVNGRRYQDDSRNWQSSQSYDDQQLAVHIANCQRALDYMLSHRPQRSREETT